MGRGSGVSSDFDGRGLRSSYALVTAAINQARVKKPERISAISLIR